MNIITLTTDLGTRDHYAAAVKGELLKALPDAQLVDISHDIAPFDIMHGAFVLKNCYHHFPKGTYHLIGVNQNNEAGMHQLLIMQEGYYFLGPDNGFFGLLWDGLLPDEIYQLKAGIADGTVTLPMMQYYAAAVSHLANGGNADAIGIRINNFRLSAIGKPIVAENFIRATIIYFDRFENAVVNIKRDEFEKIGRARKFRIYFKRYDDMDTISENYFGVQESEKVCIFNSSNYLEIAINKGNAMGLLNLNIGDIVQVEFQ